ncbi:nucleoside triphosphate pyrophosphohydrolase [Staphylospora marina]|uniref:nucleoside triphosphate pyrophosphohydrolase n=1 Tax=Staphylospora marina TaxID=2490858 RepID=UPI000F5BE33F|nr:nucleoside triphosphate pyrophosphohydrolase [Staphylospora marina]
MNGKIVITGLGFGDEHALSLGTLKLLESAGRLFLRTDKHPVVRWIRERGISFETMDEVYRRHSAFEQVYEEIAERLLREADTGETVVYAVPGHPRVAERTTVLLLKRGPERGIDVSVQGGHSFLDPLFTSLGIDPVEGFQLLDGTALDAGRIDPRGHVVIAQVYDRMTASDVKLTLMDVYPDDHPVTVASACGIPGKERTVCVPLYELDHEDRFDDLTTVYVPPVRDDRNLYGRFEFLEGIIRTLRGPDGCPWDRKQTHESLRPYLLEEAHEFLEAVAEDDPEAMADELGDILLQVMLHAQIASESGDFDIHEVIGRLSDKMIRRHPHVFGEGKAETAEEVKANWERIKRQERGGEAEPGILSGIPKGLPALSLAHALQKKAAKVGFDWDRVEEVFGKIYEELDELQRAENGKAIEDEFGDLLFAVVNLSRFLKVDPELALLGACRKFRRRFGHIEQRARESGRRLQEMSLEEMDQWWNEAKQSEK